MSNYYYLVAGLPTLSLDDGKLSYTVENFKSELYPSLSEKDKKLIDLFYLKFDNANLLKCLKDKEAEMDERGNYSGDDLLLLIEAVRQGEAREKRFPSYLYDFVELYIQNSGEEHFVAEEVLAAAYYAYAMGCGNRFVSHWFEFSLNVNNILSAFISRKYKLEVAPRIVGDTEVCEQLRTSNARDFGLGEQLDYMEDLQRIAEMDELVEREKKTDLLAWKWLEDESFFNYFTVERLFVFLLQLEMIERWISLDKEKGSELFRQMIQHLKEEVQIPEEFRK